MKPNRNPPRDALTDIGRVWSRLTVRARALACAQGRVRVVYVPPIVLRGQFLQSGLGEAPEIPEPMVQAVTRTQPGRSWGSKKEKNKKRGTTS